MADDENAPLPSKKRLAGHEISRDDPSLEDDIDDDSTELSSGTFQRASDEVLASRRIIKVRRPQSTSTLPPNPFAGIKLVPPTESVPTPPPDHPEEPQANADQTTDNAKEKTNADPETVESIVKKPECDDEVGDVVDNHADVDQSDEKDTNEKPLEPKINFPSSKTDRITSFQQLSSSKNAFTGLSGGGFTSVKPDNPTPDNEQSRSFPSFNFTNAASTPLFGMAEVKATNGFVPPEEVTHETGEENEESVFQADSALYEFSSGGWKERGNGEVKVNISMDPLRGRLVMRTKGNYRLILNSNLFPEMKLADMDKRGVTFACVNSIADGQNTALSTFALKFKDPSAAELFRSVVEAHKALPPQPNIKAQENAPKDQD